MSTVKVNVNGVYINATHFAQFDRAEAIKRLKDDQITDDDSVAGEIYDKAVEAVKSKDAEDEKIRVAKEEEDLKARSSSNQPAFTLPLLKSDKTPTLNTASRPTPTPSAPGGPRNTGDQTSTVNK